MAKRGERIIGRTKRVIGGETYTLRMADTGQRFATKLAKELESKGHKVRITAKTQYDDSSAFGAALRSKTGMYDVWSKRVEMLKPRKVKAEGDTLTLKPVLRNSKRQIIYVAKNPQRWATNYSLWANPGRGWGWMLISHHKTFATAVAAAKRLKDKDVLKVLGWR